MCSVSTSGQKAESGRATLGPALSGMGPPSLPPLELYIASDIAVLPDLANLRSFSLFALLRCTLQADKIRLELESELSKM